MCSAGRTRQRDFTLAAEHTKTSINEISIKLKVPLRKSVQSTSVIECLKQYMEMKFTVNGNEFCDFTFI